MKIRSLSEFLAAMATGVKVTPPYAMLSKLICSYKKDKVVPSPIVLVLAYCLHIRYSQQRQQPIALPEGAQLGEFEKRLLLAKQKSKAAMPDVYQIA